MKHRASPPGNSEYVYARRRRIVPLYRHGVAANTMTTLTRSAEEISTDYGARELMSAGRCSTTRRNVSWRDRTSRFWRIPNLFSWQSSEARAMAPVWLILLMTSICPGEKHLKYPAIEGKLFALRLCASSCRSTKLGLTRSLPGIGGNKWRHLKCVQASGVMRGGKIANSSAYNDVR